MSFAFDRTGGEHAAMKLTVREISAMFAVPERTVERWIREEQMPGVKVHGQYMFHRVELLEWAHRRGVRVATLPAPQADEIPDASFAAALERGGVHRDLVATDRESTLRAMIDCLPIPDEVDRELIFEVFLARENAGSTGVGDGIAIPHVRNPIILDVDEPSVTLCFLQTPVDFGAIDGKSVHTLFAIIAATPREHLHLLGRLASALHEPAFHGALLAREGTARLLELAHAAEAKLTFAASAPPPPPHGFTPIDGPRPGAADPAASDPAASDPADDEAHP
jgi:PTS system nitrogen regulatory IIA component